MESMARTQLLRECRLHSLAIHEFSLTHLSPRSPLLVQVSLESGLVQSFDARVLPSAPSSGSSLSTLPSAPALYTLAAHDSACTTLDISPHIPGCIVTGGSDKMVKIWNVEETASAVEGQEPSRSISLVTGRDLDVVSSRWRWRCRCPTMALHICIFSILTIYLSLFSRTFFGPLRTISHPTGQSLLDHLLARRRPHARSRRFQRQAPDLGRALQRRCPTNLWRSTTCVGRQRAKDRWR